MPIEMDKRYNGHKRLLGLVEPTYKRVRAVFNGETIADTPNAYLLYDHIYAPRYLFPKEHVKTDALTAHDDTRHTRMYGLITDHAVTVGDRTADKAAVTFEDPREGYDDIGEFVSFEWNTMDQWFIEDDEVFGHARHPYLRTDIRPTSRRVRVQIHGETVADTTRAVILFETGLLPRYYIPVEDVQREALRPVGTHSVCPYKGASSYYDIAVGDQTVVDAAWYYPAPVRGMESLMGRVAFYNEHDDITITVADQ